LLKIEYNNIIYHKLKYICHIFHYSDHFFNVYTPVIHFCQNNFFTSSSEAIEGLFFGAMVFDVRVPASFGSGCRDDLFADEAPEFAWFFGVLRIPLEIGVEEGVMVLGDVPLEFLDVDVDPVAHLAGDFSFAQNLAGVASVPGRCDELHVRLFPLA
jgi:hypothetical protein